MTTKLRTLPLLTIVLVFFIHSGLAQPQKDAAVYASYKLEEKKSEIAIYAMQSARRNIERQYEKMAIAQQNVDIQMLLSVTHPDYKAYTPNGDVWDYKKLEMYWAGGLKQIVSTETTEFNIKTFILSQNMDTAVVLIHQIWKRRQWMAGKIRSVSTDAEQTETWVHTNEGWKRWKIENVSNKGALVDGKRVDITKPYDPDAPEYKPDEKK